jgi:phosphoribosylformylglycinamidine synthase I
MKAKVLIVRAAGTNCDDELEAAFSWLGAQPERVHINLLLQREKALKDYDVLALPGGFSYGDHVGAGRVLALELRRLHGLKQFVESGKPVVGICNGFQALVKSGILPGPWADEPVASLAANDSGRFECRWVKLRVEQKSPFTKGLPEVIELPIACGEGRFVADEDTLKKVDGQVLFRYAEPNPTGSLADIAGITNKKGNVLGMMPHPERYLTSFHHPTRGPDTKATELGLHLLKNVLEAARA